MANNILQVSDDFWNFRGSFKIGGLIDIGTQASLVRLDSGKFVFLDSYSFDSAARRKIDELTRGGQDVEAVINLHPFHTVHVRKMHAQYPVAVQYGTARHHQRFPDLPWARIKSEDAALHEKYAGDFDFSIPRGVDFISDDQNVHFSSVLAYHRASRTIHSDDTLMYLKLPALARLVGLGDDVSFHIMLAKALERREGATRDFRDWATDLTEQWKDAENLCAAHTSALLAIENRGASIHDRIVRALKKVEGTLKQHEKKWG